MGWISEMPTKLVGEKRRQRSQKKLLDKNWSKRERWIEKIHRWKIGTNRLRWKDQVSGNCSLGRIKVLWHCQWRQPGLKRNFDLLCFRSVYIQSTPLDISSAHLYLIPFSYIWACQLLLLNPKNVSNCKGLDTSIQANSHPKTLI